MIYVFGSRLYGKVDEVKGLFHVATKFGHFDYFPLIPMGSWLVLDKSGNGWRGIEIPFSLKSMLVGWLRALAVLFMIIGPCWLVVSVNNLGDRRTEVRSRYSARGRAAADDAAEAGNDGVSSVVLASAMTAGALAVLIGFRFIPGIGRATPARAAELCRLLGLSEDAVQAVAAGQAGRPAPPAAGGAMTGGEVLEGEVLDGIPITPGR